MPSGKCSTHPQNPNARSHQSALLRFNERTQIAVSVEMAIEMYSIQADQLDRQDTRWNEYAQVSMIHSTTCQLSDSQGQTYKTVQP